MQTATLFNSKKKRYPLFVAISFSVLGVFTQGLKFWNGPMYGDDYLTTAGFIAPDNSFFSAVFNTGSGKWRPLNNIYLYFTTHYFRFDYLPYLIINRFLLIFCAVTTGLLAYAFSKSFIAVALASFSVSISHLTYMGQISIFGFMELGSTIFLVAAIHSAISSIEIREKNPPYAEFLQILSVSSFLCSCLIHERFQVASLCFFYLFRKMSSKSKRIRSRSLLFLLVPGFITVSKYLLQINPLQGGGEATFSTTVSKSLSQNFQYSILGLFGYFSGAGKFFGDVSGLDDLSRSNELKFFGVAITFLPFFLSYTFLLFHIIRQKSCSKFIDYKFWILLSLLIFFLIPGSTVISRIEARWLFQSQILLLLIGFSILHNSSVKNLFRLFSIIQVLAFIGISTIYNLHSDDYTALRNQPSSVLVELEEVSPTSGAWNLAINHTGPPMPTWWQFAYGGSFSQLSNPPTIVESCSNVKNCLTVYLYGADLDFKIR